MVQSAHTNGTACRSRPSYCLSFYSRAVFSRKLLGTLIGGSARRTDTCTRTIRLIAIGAGLGLIAPLSGCTSSSGRVDTSPQATFSVGGNTEPPLTDTPSSTPPSCRDPLQCATTTGTTTLRNAILTTSDVGCDIASSDGVSACHATIQSVGGSSAITATEIHNAQPGSSWTVAESCVGLLDDGQSCTIRVRAAITLASRDSMASAELVVTSDRSVTPINLTVPHPALTPASS
jgi:hypothetical protein